jgi:hypothetical protein
MRTFISFYAGIPGTNHRKTRVLAMKRRGTTPDEFAAMVQEIGMTFQTIIKAGDIKLE